MIVYLIENPHWIWFPNFCLQSVLLVKSRLQQAKHKSSMKNERVYLNPQHSMYSGLVKGVILENSVFFWEDKILMTFQSILVPSPCSLYKEKEKYKKIKFWRWRCNINCCSVKLTLLWICYPILWAVSHTHTHTKDF